MTSLIRTCFITAPAGTNLELLTEALLERSIQVVAPHQLATGGEPQTEISEILSNVDLVIGVLTRERRSEWILFELGQAWALGKRILVFAPPNSAHLPSTLRRFLTVRANLSNREAIGFALDQLIAASDFVPRLITTPREKKIPLGNLADAYLQGNFPIAGATEQELELLVANALKAAGVDVLASYVGPLSQERGYRADLAIWSDPLQPFVGNPLLVEIKARLQGQKATAEAAQQLSKNVAASGNLWGLLLYGNGPDEPKPLPPNILALPITTLLQRLKTESFDDVVRDLRNRRVHGVKF